MKVEIFLGVDTRWVCKAGCCWYHEQGERLGPCGCEGLLYTIRDDVGSDALDGIEKPGILEVASGSALMRPIKRRSMRGEHTLCDEAILINVV